MAHAVGLICCLLPGLAAAQPAPASEPTIIVAPMIMAELSTVVDFDVRIVSSVPLPPGTSVMISGLPKAIVFSAGQTAGPGVWQVPVTALTDLKMVVTATEAAKSNLLILLSTQDKGLRILASARSVLVVDTNKELAQVKRAEDAKRAEEAQAAEREKQAQAKKAEDARLAAEADAAEKQRKLALKKAEMERAAAQAKADEDRAAAQAKADAERERAMLRDAARKAEEEAKRAEAAKKAEEAKKAEDAKTADMARKAEQAKKAEETKQAEMAKKADMASAQPAPAPKSNEPSQAAPSPPPALPPPSEQDLAAGTRLLKRGEEALDQGNILVARQYFLRAAQTRLAAAAFKLAETYDPHELARLNVQGVVPDPDQARTWYARALLLGADEAKERLTRLGR